MNGLVTNNMDYCNAMLFGTHKYIIQRLQRVQNHAARVVVQQPKRSHVTPILKQLHWLPVRQRINFKVLMLTYKSLNGFAPDYLRQLIPAYVPTRSTRSVNKHLLVVPPKVKPSFGERAFSFAAPRLWNPLPLDIKMAPSLDTFKSRLKTFLFDNPEYPPPILK